MSGLILDTVKKFSIIWTFDWKGYLRPECRAEIWDPPFLTPHGAFDTTYINRTTLRDSQESSFAWHSSSTRAIERWTPTRLVMSLIFTGPLPIPYLMSDHVCIVWRSRLHLIFVGRVMKRAT
jgi:hypothetical protein